MILFSPIFWKYGEFIMAQSLTFTRIIFGALSVIFMITYMLSYPVGSTSMKILTGACLGGSFTLLLVGVETFFRKFNLKTFNVAIVGLFFGYLMGQALTLTFNAVVNMGSFTGNISSATIDIIRIAFFLIGSYVGTILTIRFSEEMYLSIPFVRFTQSAHNKKDLIPDLNAICDPRLVDFLATGVLNSSIVLPKCLVKELHQLAEGADESTKARVRKGLEVVKKLETMKSLGLRYSESDVPEITDITQKIARLARSSNSNILTSDSNRTSPLQADDTLYININSLSNLLKPVTPPGETISIKVQRYGKEPKQGVGYLDDGTMVVINNGGEFIGEQIDTQVISVKQTSAGRIIFTNAIVEEQGYSPVGSYDTGHAYDHE